MKVKAYDFPDDLYYDKNHYWARVEGDVVVMGTTDFARKLAGEISFVDVPEEDDEVTQGKPFGSIESGKWVGRVYAVVSGVRGRGQRGLGGRARVGQCRLLRQGLDMQNHARMICRMRWQKPSCRAKPIRNGPRLKSSKIEKELEKIAGMKIKRPVVYSPWNIGRGGVIPRA